MTRKRLIPILGVPLAAATLAVAATVPTNAMETDPPPIGVEVLTPRATFTDDVAMQLRVKLDGQRTNVLNVGDPSRVVTAGITVQPSAQFPWHTHPGPVIVTVTEGTLTYMNADDCVARPYPAGTVFVDPGLGNVHTAYNDTDEVVELVATFYGASEDGPLTVPIDGPAGGCGIELDHHEH
ncbi:MAG: cupin domain-containing protein [Ilumatobacter sp.]|nr:MAG: cupin domain-containing protein [Ilumatobacter sp.]